MENQGILKRLQEKQATYSVQRWEDNFKDNERMVAQIMEYPISNLKMRASESTADLRGRVGKLPEIDSHKKHSASHNKFKVAKKEASPKKLKPVVLDPNRTILFTGKRRLGGRVFTIEVSKDGKQTMLISAIASEGIEESYLIELADTKSDAILSEFSNDYEILADNLAVMKKRLVLLNPKFKSKKKKSTKKKGTVGLKGSQSQGDLHTTSEQVPSPDKEKDEETKEEAKEEAKE